MTPASVRRAQDTADVAADDDDGAGASKGAKTIRIAACGNNLVTVIIQTIVCASGALGSVLSGLNAERARKLDWKSNPGDVLELLVSSLGLDYNKEGTKLWKRAEPGAVLSLRPFAKPNSRKPKDERPSAIGSLDASELQHDAGAAGIGGAAAQRAAAAARPAPQKSLERVVPDAHDLLKRGSGYGNVPRALASRCVAEQHRLDTLVVMVQARGNCELAHTSYARCARAKRAALHQGVVG